MILRLTCGAVDMKMTSVLGPMHLSIGRCLVVMVLVVRLSVVAVVRTRVGCRGVSATGACFPLAAGVVVWCLETYEAVVADWDASVGDEVGTACG